MLTQYEFRLVKQVVESHGKNASPREQMDLMRAIEKIESIIFVNKGGIH